MLCPRCGSQLPEWTSRCDNCGLVLIETKVTVDRKGPYRIGDVVAERYELRDRAATGPLFWSYVAFDQEEERPVALRAVRPTLLPGLQDHDRFVAKVEPLLALAAPGLARLLRVDRDEDTTIVVSELVDGLPLRALIELRRQEGRAFSASETLAVLTSIADALETGPAPSAHGDLRPPHVLVLDDRVRLEVFGLTAAFPAEETVRALKDDPEASGYLAPEVRQGRVGDPRSDVYAFAILAGELLTGRIPPALGVGLDDFLGHVPPLSEEVLRKSLSPEPGARDATPSELVEALSAVLGAETWKPQVRRAGSSEPSFPKDPALPAEAAESGTIPAISPFAYLPPAPAVAGPAAGPRARAAEPEPDETQRNEASAIARAAAALEDEAELARDPAISVQPAAEGTVQITSDMIEPDSALVAIAKAADAAGARPVERDPAISVQPAAEGTVQITADMIEPAEEDFVTSPRAQISPRPAATEEAAATSRSEGLDPRLVRAAKQLDKQRKTASTEPTETAPAPAPEAAPVDAESSEENVQTTIQRSKPWAPPPEAGPRAATPRLEALPSLEAEAPAGPGVVTRPAGPRAATGASPDRPGLVRGFVGPIEIKTARGAVAAPPSEPGPAAAESPSPDEAQRLPAVMVDRSLTEAFGPPLVPEEPTYRVKREDALRPPSQPASRAHPGKAKSSVPWWQWLLFIALLTGALTLVGLGSLWLLNAG